MKYGNLYQEISHNLLSLDGRKDVIDAYNNLKHAENNFSSISHDIVREALSLYMTTEDKDIFEAFWTPYISLSSNEKDDESISGYTLWLTIANALRAPDNFFFKKTTHELFKDSFAIKPTPARIHLIAQAGSSTTSSASNSIVFFRFKKLYDLSEAVSNPKMNQKEKNSLWKILIERMECRQLFDAFIRDAEHALPFLKTWEKCHPSLPSQTFMNNYLSSLSTPELIRIFESKKSDKKWLEGTKYLKEIRDLAGRISTSTDLNKALIPAEEEKQSRLVIERF